MGWAQSRSPYFEGVSLRARLYVTNRRKYVTKAPRAAEITAGPQV
jgi:hypothetical protein